MGIPVLGLRWSMDRLNIDAEYVLGAKTVRGALAPHSPNHTKDRILQ